MHFKKNIQYRMQLDNVYKLFAYVEKVPWIQTFWFVILVMSLVLSLCLTCCSNTDIRCCCFCCNVFSRMLCLARRRKRGEKHNQLRCKICRKSTSSVGVRLGALQNKEVFCWIIFEIVLQIQSKWYIHRVNREKAFYEIYHIYETFKFAYKIWWNIDYEIPR